MKRIQIYPCWATLLPACVCVLLVAAVSSAQESLTYRGNSARTGGDGKPGPAVPRVLWTYKTREHFIAAPVASGDRLFVSGLSFLNSSLVHSLDVSAKTDKRVVWTRTSPLLAMPTVSSPAIYKGQLLFGDGMHQTSGASLYSLDVATGQPHWQLTVEGNLVHLEGSPSIAEGKVYIGGGAAGVLCLDPTRLSFEGKEMPAATIAGLIQKRRKELQEKFEQAKKQGDAFAVPPTDQDIPRPSPALVWQMGKNTWHVDAPLAITEGKVLVASAFLDKEMVGKRALLCLDAKSGKELWSVPLSINPWGGPSVQGRVVVVTGSTIAYDRAALKGARGLVAAFDLDSGKPLWKKDLPGGVLGCAALSKDVAVLTCTDGKVRAYTLTSGAIRWTYTAGTPFFAPVALDDELAYAADLKGVVHAIGLRTGVNRWKLDLASDSAVAAPGMVYAGPVVQAGRLYVATCNIAGEHVNKPTAVVCIGEK